MAGSSVSEGPRVSREAFREFGRWQRRFTSQVSQCAEELAKAQDAPALITSAVLAEAVLLTCQKMIDDIHLRHEHGKDPNGEEAKAA